MDETAPDRDHRSKRFRRPLIVAGAVALAFIVGFGWQWLEARGYRAERDTAQRELATERLAATLATAIIEADRGSYEGARELASRFFTGLQERVAEAADDEEAADVTELRDILARRDAVITTLSRSDPSSEAVLTQMFVRFRLATGGEEVGVPIPAAEPGEPVPAGGDTGAAAGGG